MAEEKTESLIGYDPLAWMIKEKAAEQVDSPASFDHSGEVADTKPASFHGDAEISGTVDYDGEKPGLFAGKETTVETASAQDSPGGVRTIVLEPVLNIRSVAALHEQLLTALDAGNKLEIDASAVTVADTSTLQLLLILKRTAIGLQKDVVIDFPSEKFMDACNLLGLSEMLGLNQAPAGLF